MKEKLSVRRVSESTGKGGKSSGDVAQPKAEGLQSHKRKGNSKMFAPYLIETEKGKAGTVGRG